MQGRVGRRRRLTPLRALVLVAVLAVALVGAFGVWYVLFRESGPPPIGPGAPVIPAGAVSTHRVVASPAVTPHIGATTAP